MSLGGWLPWRHRCWDRFPERVSFFKFAKHHGNTPGSKGVWSNERKSIFSKSMIWGSTFDFKCSLLALFTVIFLGWDHAKVCCIYGRTIGNPHLTLENVGLA